MRKIQKLCRAPWLLASLLAFTVLLVSRPQVVAEKAAAASQLTERQKVIHALNRLTFGPRPGDIDRVHAQGLEKWIDQQLHPERISESDLNSRLGSFPTLNMNTREMVENYPPPQLIRAIAEGRVPLPRDPEKRALYEAQIERYRRRQQVQARQRQSGGRNEEAGQMMPTADPVTMSGDDRAERREDRRKYAQTIRDLRNAPADERGRMLAAMDAETQRAILFFLRPEERQELLSSLSPEQRASLAAMANPPQAVVTEVAQAKLLRAVYSERQFEEVLTDFWFNHFNVFIGKGLDRYLVTSYEREVIRPYVFGKFQDLLVATAKSPAMLWYLDNWQSVGSNSPAARNQGFRGRLRQRRPERNPAQAQQAPPRGLNENYARELMELHTIGVDGGYTQKDVTELARVFSGWTLREPRRGGGYMFRPAMHDPGAKTVLGKRIAENGEKEGLQVLAMLARHPATAKFISTKLAQRFVADQPPASLIHRMAETFGKTDGDLREVYRTMLRSPEFWDADAYRAKVKTPLEFLTSAVRASGAEVGNAMPLLRTLNEMGMPLYGAQPPTGYSTKAENWVNSAALLSRMNFALALASGRLPGVTVEAQEVLGPSVPDRGDRQQLLQRLGDALLAGELSAQTTATIQKQLQAPQSVSQGLPTLDSSQSVGLITGLLLGSPEFQRR